MYVMLNGQQHRVHVREDHQWTLRCGMTIDPWIVEGAGSRSSSVDVCERCTTARPHPDARKARRSGGPSARERQAQPAQSSGLCAACRERPKARGKGGYCPTCAHRFLPRCRQCGGRFVPDQRQSQSTKCSSCRKSKKRGGRSVWVIASAGSPGLGKRA